MSTETPPSETAHPRVRATREVAARIWRSRASRLATIWLTVALVEYVVWRLFLSQTFYRDVFTPIAIAAVVAGLAASWRTRMRRERDRREGDRRAQERRTAPAPQE